MLYHIVFYLLACQKTNFCLGKILFRITFSCHVFDLCKYLLRLTAEANEHALLLFKSL